MSRKRRMNKMEQWKEDLCTWLQWSDNFGMYPKVLQIYFQKTVYTLQTNTKELYHTFQQNSQHPNSKNNGKVLFYNENGDVLEIRKSDIHSIDQTHSHERFIFVHKDDTMTILKSIE